MGSSFRRRSANDLVTTVTRAVPGLSNASNGRPRRAGMLHRLEVAMADDVRADAQRIAAVLLEGAAIRANRR